jgi:hypothetical protein
VSRGSLYVPYNGLVAVLTIAVGIGANTAKAASLRFHTSNMALPSLWCQHEHRTQPHCTTTGLSMQASGFFMTLNPLNGSRRCERTSSHPYVSNAKLQLTNHSKTHVPGEKTRSTYCLTPWLAPPTDDAGVAPLPIKASYRL